MSTLFLDGVVASIYKTCDRQYLVSKWSKFSLRSIIISLCYTFCYVKAIQVYSMKNPEVKKKLIVVRR